MDKVEGFGEADVCASDDAEARRIWPEFTRPFGFPAGGQPLCQASSSDVHTSASPPSAWIVSPSEKQNSANIIARGSQFVCAVDVGTGSARAGILDASGKLLGRVEHPILMNQPLAGHAEHDSEDIWKSVCIAVQGAVAASKVDPSHVVGISFDATCSLVVRDEEGSPLTVSTSGEKRWDTIVWLDHRALDEADECTATGHKVLSYLGGVMSPEMQTPKLMWLKRHLPETWNKAGYFFDLADYLSWRASGSLARSQCTLTCKWTYLAHELEGWQPDYLETIGLEDLVERGNLPERASPMGADVGRLTPEAAKALGLTTSCHVGAGLIDAYAGALGVLGGFAGDLSQIDRHLALIAGTSSCLMALVAGADFLQRWLGAVLWRCSAGLLAQRRRPVRDRSVAGPYHPLAWSRW